MLDRQVDVHDCTVADSRSCRSVPVEHPISAAHAMDDGLTRWTVGAYGHSGIGRPVEIQRGFVTEELPRFQTRQIFEARRRGGPVARLGAHPALLHAVERPPQIERANRPRGTPRASASATLNARGSSNGSGLGSRHPSSVDRAIAGSRKQRFSRDDAGSRLFPAWWRSRRPSPVSQRSTGRMSQSSSPEGSLSGHLGTRCVHSGPSSRPAAAPPCLSRTKLQLSRRARRPLRSGTAARC